MTPEPLPSKSECVHQRQPSQKLSSRVRTWWYDEELVWGWVWCRQSSWRRCCPSRVSKSPVGVRKGEGLRGIAHGCGRLPYGRVGSQGPGGERHRQGEADSLQLGLEYSEGAIGVIPTPSIILGLLSGNPFSSALLSPPLDRQRSPGSWLLGLASGRPANCGGRPHVHRPCWALGNGGIPASPASAEYQVQRPRHRGGGRGHFPGRGG